MIDFVNCPYKDGNLSPSEREFLYRWVSKIKPVNILEVGTGRGGSTTYMAEAIKDMGIPCLLFTCDTRRKPVPEFFEQYPFVRYKRMPSSQLIMYLLTSRVRIGFIFFDGPDDPDLGLRDLLRLEKSINHGTYFSMHDWDCKKSVMVREYLENSDKWEKKH
jgi:hypothetical protein